MNEITEYSSKFEEELFTICESLYAFINKMIYNSKCKLYHGAPVWFIDDNPIVGYSRKRNSISLLFWSGQSFTESGLSLVGKFKAAEIIYSKNKDIDYMKLKKWIEESQKVIWNYKDIRKNDGEIILL